MKIIPSFKPAIDYKSLNRVLSRVLIGGVSEYAVSRFEERFAQYLGVRHAISAPSGRWALYSILKGLDLQEGDEVILPAFTYFAVPTASLLINPP